MVSITSEEFIPESFILQNQGKLQILKIEIFLDFLLRAKKSWSYIFIILCHNIPGHITTVGKINMFIYHKVKLIYFSCIYLVLLVYLHDHDDKKQYVHVWSDWENTYPAKCSAWSNID